MGVKQSVEYDEARALEAAEASIPFGATISVVAAELEVDRNRVKMWARENAPFATALARARARADREVIGGLYQVACGYEYFEEMPTKDGGVVAVARKKHPDPRAALDWLRFRDAEDWGDYRPSEEDEDDDVSKKPVRELVGELASITQEASAGRPARG